MSNIYQQKYQKYKLKYLNLLNQSGGTKTLEEIKANYAEKKQILQAENSMAIKNASQNGEGDLSDVYEIFNKKEEELEKELEMELMQYQQSQMPQQAQRQQQEQEKMPQQAQRQQQELMQQKQKEQETRAQNEFEKQKKIMEQQQRAQEQEKMQQQVQMQQQAQKKLEEQQQARMQQQQQARMQQQQPQQVRMQQQPQPQQQTRNDAIVIANETLLTLDHFKNIINEIEKKQIDLKNIISQMEKKQINLKTNYNCNCQNNGMTLEKLKQNEKAEIDQLEKWYNTQQAEFSRKGNGKDIEDAFSQFNKLLIIEKDKHSRIIQTKYEQLKQQQATISNNKK